MKYENGYPVAPCVLLNSTRDNEKILDKVEAIMKLIGVANYLTGIGIQFVRVGILERSKND